MSPGQVSLCACACMQAHAEVSSIGRRGLHQSQGLWLGSRCCLWLGSAESKDLSLVEQLVEGLGSEDTAFPRCKKAIGKLTFLFSKLSSCYINSPQACPPNTQVLSDFRVSGSRSRKSGKLWARSTTSSERMPDPGEKLLIF